MTVRRKGQQCEPGHCPLSGLPTAFSPGLLVYTSLTWKEVGFAKGAQSLEEVKKS